MKTDPIHRLSSAAKVGHHDPCKVLESSRIDEGAA